MTDSEKRLYRDLVGTATAVTVEPIVLEDVKDTYNVSLSEKRVTEWNNSLALLGVRLEYDFWDDTLYMKLDKNAKPQYRKTIISSNGVFIGTAVTSAMLGLNLIGNLSHLIPWPLVFVPALIPVVSGLFNLIFIKLSERKPRK